MLLAHRLATLIGMNEKPNDKQVEEYAKEATTFLLSAIS